MKRERGCRHENRDTTKTVHQQRTSGSTHRRIKCSGETMKKKSSVQPGKSSCDKAPDRNNGTKLIVINGMEVLQSLDSEYHIEHSTWERSCDLIRKSFRRKTSRSIKNDKEYETTRWYRVMPDGSMKSTGSSEEPDYSEFYTPEPKPSYGFTVWVPDIRIHRDEHIVIEEKDYKENLKIFKDCLVFKLENCENYMHPLSANPDQVLSVRVLRAAGPAWQDRTNNSVRNPGAISEGSRGRTGQKDGVCWNDGDCDECDHSDECPVGAEDDEDDE